MKNSICQSYQASSNVNTSYYMPALSNRSFYKQPELSSTIQGKKLDTILNSNVKLNIQKLGKKFAREEVCA